MPRQFPRDSSVYQCPGCGDVKTAKTQREYLDRICAECIIDDHEGPIARDAREHDAGLPPPQWDGKHRPAMDRLC